MNATIYGKVISDIGGNEAAMGAEKSISTELRLVQSNGAGTLRLVSHLNVNGTWEVCIMDDTDLIYLQHAGNIYDNMNLRRPKEEDTCTER